MEQPGQGNQRLKESGYMGNSIKPIDSDSYRYAPSVMSQLSFFPARKPDVNYIKKTNGRSAIIITPTEGKWSYGSVPRLFLLYIRTLIKNKDSRVDFESMTVNLGGSYRAMCEAMGASTGGKSKRLLLESIKNLACTHITLEHWVSDDSGMYESFPVAQKVCIDFGGEDKESYITFSSQMWSLLIEEAVPAQMSIIRNISNSALALDIYMWLAFRTNKLRSCGMKVPWKDLTVQFEDGDYPVKEFKRRFTTALNKVKESWPELKASLDEYGITVYPSISSIHSNGKIVDAVVVKEESDSCDGHVIKADVSCNSGQNDSSTDDIRNAANPF